jgi:NADPH:quinone reductase
MRALRFHEFGGLDKLALESLPEAHSSPDDMVVRISAASINPSDVKNVAGKMVGTTLPRTPGRDFAGVVVEGSPVQVGKPIWGTGGEIGFTRDGSHAESILIPRGAFAALPVSLTPAQGASVGVNFVTAYRGLYDCARVQKDDVVLVTGATGGVGSAVLQLANAQGASCIAVGRLPMNKVKLPDVNLLGYIDSSREDLAAAASELTSGKGATISFDCVGGELFEPTLKTLRDSGRAVVITSTGERRVSFDLLDFYHHRLTLFGVDSRALTVVDCAAILNRIGPMFDSGLLKPAQIGLEGKLDDAVALYSAVSNSSAAGKVVFAMS